MSDLPDRAVDGTLPVGQTIIDVELTEHMHGRVWWWRRTVEQVRADCPRCRAGAPCLMHVAPILQLDGDRALYLDIHRFCRRHGVPPGPPTLYPDHWWPATALIDGSDSHVCDDCAWHIAGPEATS